MKRKIYKLLSSAKQGLFALALTVFSGTAYSQTTYTFNYTGSIQTISLPAGNYSIECWGADGGDGFQTSQIANGGKGGYSAGLLNLTAAQTISIYVGGAGTDANGTTVGQICAGGFNGGGASGANNYVTAASYRAGGGGGGSDIRVGGTALSDRVIVAGGGGGGVYSTTYPGGNGGGTSGSNGGNTYHGDGGTQLAGGLANGSAGNIAGTTGALGIGGTGGTAASKSAGGGGGGGYYGGGGGATGNSSSSQGAGGGGSGYIGGVTGAVTSMSGTPGFVSNPDLTGNGLVLVKELCSISLSVSGLNPNNALCAGNSVTITTNAVSNYSWSTGSNAPVLVVSPTTNSVYGLTATSPSNCTSSSQVSINVSPTPSINITNNTPAVCLGNQAVISVSGADTYSWSTSSTAANVTVVPTQSTTYTVTGTSTLSNCSSTQTVSVDVITVSVTISGNSTICKGNTATLTANSNGATSYSWSTGLPIQSILVSPATHSIYLATAIVQTLNITCNAISSVTVTVNDNPNIVVVANKSSMCVNEPVAISAGGGTAYAWSWGAQTSSGPAITITPSVSANLIVNVTGTGANGCTSTNTVVILVDACTGISEASLLNNVLVYPNPSQGEINIALGSAAELLLISETGQLVRKISLSEENEFKANISGLSNGMYFITGQNGTQRISKKVVISR